MKGVITKNETENSDRIDEMKKQHKKLLAETKEKAKKLESAKEKVERSKEEAIQTLNEKIRYNKVLIICPVYMNQLAPLTSAGKRQIFFD